MIPYCNKEEFRFLTSDNPTYSKTPHGRNHSVTAIPSRSDGRRTPTRMSFVRNCRQLDVWRASRRLVPDALEGIGQLQGEEQTFISDRGVRRKRTIPVRTAVPAARRHLHHTPGASPCRESPSWPAQRLRPTRWAHTR